MTKGADLERSRRRKRLAAKARAATDELHEQMRADFVLHKDSLRDIEADTGIPFSTVRTIVERIPVGVISSPLPATDDGTLTRYTFTGTLEPGFVVELVRRGAGVDVARCRIRADIDSDPIDLATYPPYDDPEPGLVLHWHRA